MPSDTRHIPDPSVSSTTETIVERREVSIDDDTNHPVKPQTLPPVIPSSHQHRNLIVCFDGTGDQFDADNSNVVQFVSLLKKDDRNRQLVYYQTGIGTSTGANTTVSPWRSQLRKILDTMFAHSIDAHIMGKLVAPAFTLAPLTKLLSRWLQVLDAELLAGMIHKIGLLPPSNYEQVPFAYTMYLRTDGVGWDQANEFKRAFSIDVDVEFLGVWDTVASIGFKPEGLPFATSKKFIRTYRHAVSLDERRAKFQPNLWNEPTRDEANLGLHEDESGKPDTDTEEVWFAGCHCDVGGGSVNNRTRNSLARIPLRWMVREIFKAETGILFLTDRLYEIGLDPSTIYPVVLKRRDPLPVGENKICERPRNEAPIRPSMYRPWKRVDIKHVHPPHETGPDAMMASEEHEELKDALSPIYDQMSINKWWWLFEYMPLPIRRQWKGLEWKTYLWFNRGKERFVKWTEKGLKVHRSVKMRMEAESGKYKPQVKFVGQPEWVE
ncbi:hypothetical protein H1R20_g12181, partial [Candolleomyces eurysporus]